MNKELAKNLSFVIAELVLENACSMIEHVSQDETYIFNICCDALKMALKDWEENGMESLKEG